MKEAYKGSDIKKAYPKDEYWTSTYDGDPIEPNTLYIIHLRRLTPKFMEVEFEPLKIWTGPTS